MSIKLLEIIFHPIASKKRAAMMDRLKKDQIKNREAKSHGKNNTK